MSVDEIVRTIAAWDLQCRPTAAPIELSSASEWSALLQTVRDQRLEGPLARMIDDGGLVVDADQRGEAEGAHVEAMALVVRIDDVVRRLVDALRDARVPTRILKGPATARLDYGEPSLRSYGDADVLVPTREYERATAVLGAEGFVRRTPELTPGFDRRFAKAVTFSSKDGLEVDLHRTLVYGPFSVGIAEADLWSSGVPVDFGGTIVNALDVHSRFVHACIHAATGAHPRFTSLRDVAVIGARVDGAAVLSLAARWRVEPLVARAATLVRSRLGVEFAWLSGGEAPGDYRVRCSVDRDSWASATLGLLVALPSWSDRRELAKMLSSSVRSRGLRSLPGHMRSVARVGFRSTVSAAHTSGALAPR
jgi:hypothetical protein